MIRYDKLVRDRIPEMIQAAGKQCEVRVLDDVEYAHRLDQKLAEELAEYQGSGELEELADLVELVEAIAAARGMDWAGFESLRREKHLKRGGFSERLLLIAAEQ